MSTNLLWDSFATDSIFECVLSLDHLGFTLKLFSFGFTSPDDRLR